MESGWTEWAGILLRFTHVLAAIMWIGNSLLFTWMELNLIAPPKDKGGGDPDLLGKMDMLHGGGVFHLQKRVLHGDAIPERLHWFKWQSYTTWITGFLLLGLLFHSNGATLLDATRSDLSPHAATGLSLGGLLAGWLIYDFIWRSPLKKTPAAGIVVSLLGLFGAAWFLGQHFNGRALFLQIGAMMATCMSANVFFHIMGNQHRFMRALREGKPHDLSLGKAAKTRSLHNHYMTFPVLFLMLSAHFPKLYATDTKVLVLITCVLALMVVKHLMNTRYHFKGWLVSLFAVVAGASLLVAFLLRPAPAMTMPDPDDDPVAAGRAVFEHQGCNACHLDTMSQIAPDLRGVAGAMQTLADGSMVLADDAYLRQSILEPQAQVVQGYAPAMPPYEGRITDEELDLLIAYLKSIGTGTGNP